jgi:hypothetical protein
MRSEIAALPLFDFSTSTPYAKTSETSRAAAIEAQPRAGSQAARLLHLYTNHGPQTDHQASSSLGLPIATICARRHSLIDRGLVIEHGTIEGPYQHRNVRWGVK